MNEGEKKTIRFSFFFFSRYIYIAYIYGISFHKNETKIRRVQEIDKQLIQLNKRNQANKNTIN